MNNGEILTSTSSLQLVIDIIKDVKTDIKDMKTEQKTFKEEIRQDIRTLQATVVTLSGAIVQKQTTETRKKVAYLGILGALLTVVTSLTLYIIHII